MILAAIILEMSSIQAGWFLHWRKQAPGCDVNVVM